MHLYVELWNARPAWLTLSEAERQEYVANVGPGIQELTDVGVELIGFARNDADAPHRAGYRYLAAWKMPSREQVELLESILEQAGWHDYFEQTNARGEIMPPQEALGDMVQLQGEAR